MAGVKKTLKLFIGGTFARSESGRTMPVVGVDGIVHAARASRKDVRDAVRAARAAQAGWSGRTAYNRGQIIFRIAEVLAGRSAEFEALARASGATAANARREILAAVERAVYYAGWCDKLEQILSTKNPVAGPHFNVSSPEPTGVVGVVAPNRPSFLGLVSTVLPPLCAGNAIVALASESDPHSAVAFAEVVATSDVPAGVVNVLTGARSELVEHIARHMDVNALDLWISDGVSAKSAAVHGAENVKRVRTTGEPPPRYWFSDAAQSLRHIEPFVEIKTVWHPAGL